MQCGLYGSVSWRLKNLDKIVKDNNIDAIIELCHPGCKPACGQTSLINKYFNEKQIPHLSITADLIDPENYSIEQIRTRIEAFAEILSNKSVTKVVEEQ